MDDIAEKIRKSREAGVSDSEILQYIESSGLATPGGGGGGVDLSTPKSGTRPSGVFGAPQRLGQGLGSSWDTLLNQSSVESMSKTDQDIVNKNILLATKLRKQGKVEAADRLLGENKKVTNRMSDYTQRNLDTTNQKADIGTEDLIKGGVGTAAWVAPGGNTALARIGSGIVSGGMAGYGGSDRGEEFGSTVGGAVVGGAISGGIEAVGGTYRFLKNLGGKIANKFSSATGFDATTAAKEIGKATPSQWQKALEEHGVDLNAIIKKYYPPGAGLDDVLGPVNQRGDGGVLQQQLKTSEKVIQDTVSAAGKNFRISGDDIIAVLKQEAKVINKELGGGARKEAIKEMIRQVEKKYAKGVTAKQAIETLRYANKKFGKNIVETGAGDAIASATQKVEANVLKKTLKTLFPDLADALKTQEEIFTLQPILNRARAISNTEGSILRRGLEQFDLAKPFTWLPSARDAVMSDPKMASKFLNKGTETLVQPQGKNILQGLNNLVVPGSVSSLSGNGPVNQEVDQVGDQIEEPNGGQNFEDQNYHDDSISQITDDINLEVPGAPSKEDIRGAMLMAIQNGDKKSFDALKALREEFYPDGATKKISATLENRIQLGKSGIRALDSIEKMLEKDPNKILKSYVPGKIGARDYDSAAFRAVEGLLRARSGAAVPETEVRRYMKANLPSFGDSQGEIEFKLAAFRQDLIDVANSGGVSEVESLMMNE